MGIPGQVKEAVEGQDLEFALQAVTVRPGLLCRDRDRNDDVAEVELAVGAFLSDSEAQNVRRLVFFRYLRFRVWIAFIPTNIRTTSGLPRR